MAKKREKKPSRRPFDHAEDLAEAYRELDKTLRRMKEREAEAALWPVTPYSPRARREEVYSLSTYQLMRLALEAQLAVAPVVRAAHRVHAAVHGPKSAARCAAEIAREVRTSTFLLFQRGAA